MKEAAVAVILCVLAVQSVAALNLAAAEQTRPKLNAGISVLDPYASLFVNETAWPYPQSWHWEAHMRVDYSASDGSHPQVSILWSDDVGGTFLQSRTSQEVHWRSPPTIVCFIMNATVSAPGYESGSGPFAAANFDIPDPSGGYVQPNAQNCPSGNRSTSTTTATRIQSSCTVLGKGGVTVHVVDEKGKPIQNALVMINGTFICIEEALNQSGITDSNGDAMFSLVPDAKYNITVILPENRPIIVTTIRVAHTVWTTVDIGCTPSVNQCTIAAPRSETQTTSITSAPIGWLGFPAILITILLGLFATARKRKRKGAR